jgi:hypothetical protein
VGNRLSSPSKVNPHSHECVSLRRSAGRYLCTIEQSCNVQFPRCDSRASEVVSVVSNPQRSRFLFGFFHIHAVRLCSQLCVPLYVLIYSAACPRPPRFSISLRYFLLVVCVPVPSPA